MQNERSLQDVLGLLNALQCGAMVVDSGGRILAVNDRAGAMLGRPTGALVGAALMDLYPDAEGREAVQRCLSHFDHACEGESSLSRPDGTNLTVMLAGRPMAAMPPLSDLRLITLIDISHQKQAEISLREQYREMVRLSDTVLEQALSLKRYSHALEMRVQERTVELREANMDALYMLAVASEAKDEDTGTHVRRIQLHAELLARELGLSEKDSHEIGYSAVLHDVGKIHVPDEILHKPGRLDEQEWSIMRQHTLTGERILSDRPFFSIARRIARNHHENWDGSGYPDGLARETIPLPARIVRVADVYDALLSRRAYKPAWTRADATRAILDGAGTLFDPLIVEAFTNAQGRQDSAPGASSQSATELQPTASSPKEAALGGSGAVRPHSMGISDPQQRRR